MSLYLLLDSGASILRVPGVCRYRLQPEVVILEPVVGSKADSLAQICPGLFTVEGSGPSRRAVAGDARQHEKQLEKVWEPVTCIS